MLLNLARAHPCVAVDFLVGTKARLLPLARASHAIADRRGTFLRPWCRRCRGIPPRELRCADRCDRAMARKFSADNAGPGAVRIGIRVSNRQSIRTGMDSSP